MRIRLAKFITVFVIILNFIALYFIWKLILSHGKLKTDFILNVKNTSILDEKIFHKVSKKTLQNEVTFVMRSLESFDNDIAATVKSILNVFPNTSVLIVTDTPLYPPIVLHSSVRVLNLKTSLINSFKDRNPVLQITTKYVFFIPDSTRFNSIKLLDKLVNIAKINLEKLIAIPYKGCKPLKCISIHLNIREWQVRFYEFPHARECDLVKGKHALFVETEVLLNVSDSFMLPFPESLYIQSSFQQNKVSSE